jgi:hypothetical protein
MNGYPFEKMFNLVEIFLKLRPMSTLGPEKIYISHVFGIYKPRPRALSFSIKLLNSFYHQAFVQDLSIDNAQLSILFRSAHSRPLNHVIFKFIFYPPPPPEEHGFDCIHFLVRSSRHEVESHCVYRKAGHATIRQDESSIK